MTRYLIIVRHAKAESHSASLPDFDRELNRTGLVDASRMGVQLKEKGISPTLILSSPAARTFATARLMGEQLDYEEEKIRTRDNLYDASMRHLLEAINEAPSDCASLMLVGHNPNISYLAEYLTGEETGELPTCGVVLVDFENLTWAEVAARTGKLVQILTP